MDKKLDFPTNMKSANQQICYEAEKSHVCFYTYSKKLMIIVSAYKDTWKDLHKEAGELMS